MLRYGLTLAPTGIDPHLNASAELGIPLASVYDTLIVQDPVTAEFVPGLAESWTISEDGRTYTFHLRQDVEFHDGTSLNAAAVVSNLEYVVDPDHHSQKAIFMLGPFEEAEAIDEFTVALHLAEPYAPLLDSLSQVYLGIASPSALEEWGPEGYPFHQVGSGPFRFIEYVPNDQLRLAQNPDYRWSPEIYFRSTPDVDQVEFGFYVDPPTRALALESGRVDLIGEVPAHDAQRLLNSGEFRIYPVAIPGQPLQILFHVGTPPTDDLRVRQALILSVDRQAIVNSVFGGLSPVAHGPLSADLLESAGAGPAEFDPAQAAMLLDEAGWRSDGGPRRKNGQPLALKLVVPDWGSHPEVAQLLEIAWEALGAEVEIEIAAGFGPLREAQARGGYHAIAFNSFGTDPDLLTPFYETGGLYNWMGISDPEVDQWLTDGRSALVPSEREIIYSRIADRIRQEGWILPIRDYVNLVVAGQRVEGLRYSPQGWFPYLLEFSLTP